MITQVVDNMIIHHAIINLVLVIIIISSHIPPIILIAKIAISIIQEDRLVVNIKIIAPRENHIISLIWVVEVIHQDLHTQIWNEAVQVGTQTMDTRRISQVNEDQVTFNLGMMDHSTFNNKMDNIILVLKKIQMFYQAPIAKANLLKWHHQIINKQKINLPTSAIWISKATKKYLNLLDLKKILTINIIKAFNQAGGKIHKFKVIQTLMKLCNMKFNKNENKFQYHQSM